MAVRKVKLIGLTLVGLTLLIVFIFFIVGFFKPKVAGIYIESNPSASVYINGEQVGRTPYKGTRGAGEVLVRLIPDSFEKPLAPYETKIALISGVETVIRRDFGEVEDTSAGEIISFEKVGRGETGLVVITSPEGAQLTIDASQKVFTPYKTSEIATGNHMLTLSSEGFSERNIELKTYQGYRLTALVKLAKSTEVKATISEPSVTPEAEERRKGEKEVEILETGTGFLRVRAEASTLGEEVGRVTPGNRYPLIETDEKTGWFKIEYEKGKEGWVSNQYAKEIGGESLKPTLTSTPSPTKAPTPKQTQP